jgi:hypothetical protein
MVVKPKSSAIDFTGIIIHHLSKLYQYRIIGYSVSFRHFSLHQFFLSTFGRSVKPHRTNPATLTFALPAPRLD